MQLMLMMLASRAPPTQADAHDAGFAGPRQHKTNAADAHDAGFAGPANTRQMQLMLMMLAWRAPPTQDKCS